MIEETGVAAGVLESSGKRRPLAKQTPPYDVQLEAGQIILGGSFTPLRSARKGDTFHVDYGK